LERREKYRMAIEQKTWPPVVGQSVRLKSEPYRHGEVVGIEGTGGDAVYLVVVMRSIITGRSGEFRRIADEPIRWGLADLER
jgi:hypothetical protein